MFLVKEKPLYRRKQSKSQAEAAPLDDLPSILREPEAAYIVEKVRDGLAMEEFHGAQDLLGVNEERLAGLLGMSRATLHRRKKAGQLDRSESDRLVRFARIISRASAALGGLDGARAWLAAPARAFHGECPLDYADTEIGAREVEALLGRIEHGVFS